MRVKATKLGFYGEGKSMRRRKEGEIFELIKPEDFSSKWMENLDKKNADVANEAAPKLRGNPAWRKKEE